MSTAPNSPNHAAALTNCSNPDPGRPIAPIRQPALMRRREFIRSAGASATLAAAGIAAAQQPPAAPAQSASSPPPFIGIQMGPHSMMDEGLDRCLDFIQETAAVNCLFVYSHTYQHPMNKPPQMLAPDHPVPPRDMLDRKYPSVWVKHHEQFFNHTVLRHQKLDNTFEYAGRDLFAELVAPTRRRGMKLYARILEGWGQFAADGIENFTKVETIDVHGQPVLLACWNNPDYINFWTATVEDMFRTYDLDGLQWGSERSGPLAKTIVPRNDTVPTCFCEHCRARGRDHGIDAERARQGFENLYNYVRALRTNQPKPADGVFTGFLRILLRYPEILAWEYQYRLSREEMLQAIYKTVKSIKPAAQVGWHIDTEAASFDLVARAEMTYADMAPYSDFIKYVAYHDIMGPRIRGWYLDLLQRGILAEVPEEDSLSLYYHLFGYDNTIEPKLADLNTTGFSPDYVYRETKRSVASAAGKTKIYTGVGFDVPWGAEHVPADPEKVYQAVLKSFEAGAAGIVASREYEEMRLANLQAVGRAARQIANKQPR